MTALKSFSPGDRVVKDPATWLPKPEFEAWGCGEGIGVVLPDPPDLPLADIGAVDVQWPAGRAIHDVRELLPAPGIAERREIA